MKKGNVLKTVLACTLALFTACSQRPATAQLAAPQKIADCSFISRQPGTAEKYKNYISSITSANMLSENRISVLQGNGITVKATQMAENEDGTLTVTLNIENRKGKSLDLPITAMVDFETYGDGFHGEKLYWGSLNTADDEIILTTLNDVYIIDKNTLKVKDTAFDMSAVNSGIYYLGDTVKKGDEYITCCYSETNDNNGLLIFNPDGSLKQYIETDRYFFGGRYDSRQNRAYALDLDAKTELYFIDSASTLLMDTDEYGTYGGYVCDLSTGEFLHCIYKFVTPLPDSDSTLKIIDNQRGTYYASVFSPAGKVEDSFSFEASLHQSFGDTSVYGREEMPMTTEKTAQDTYVVYCPDSAQQLTLNFADRTAQAEYVYDSRWKYDFSETSPDGKFELVRGASHGGGDVSYSTYVLKELSTWKMKYIDEISGMYGGGEDAGFFKNGDVYSIAYDNFLVYDTDMDNLQPVFAMADNFQLGENFNGKGTNRYLVAARRNPEDFSYIAVYFDLQQSENYNDKFLNNDEDSSRLKGTYNVALLDRQGRLIKSYDTGEHRRWSYFGIEPVSIYMKNENELGIYSYFKSEENKATEGFINLDTGVYTKLK